MKVEFRLVNGKSVSLELDLSEPISDIKIKLGEYFQIDPSTMKLLIAKQTIKDDCRLSDLNLTPGTVIQIITLKRSPKPLSFSTAKPKSFFDFNDMPISSASEGHIRKPICPLGLPPRCGQKCVCTHQDPKNFPQTVQMLMEMGFEKDKCERALRAAFYNSDRAAEYLIENKIPNNLTTDEVREIEKDRDHFCDGSETCIKTMVNQNFNELTNEQKVAINNLESKGYPRDTVIQVYLACDMDESIASSCLLSMQPLEM